MKRTFVPKVVTANALLEGDAIYRTADGGWTRAHTRAALYTDAAAAEAALAAAEADAATIVGAYLADARPGPNGPEPVHFREAFRTRGPSNYAHGKQVEHV